VKQQTLGSRTVKDTTGGPQQQRLIFFKSVNIWQSYEQECGCLMHFAHLANTLLKDEENARDNHVLAGNFAKYSPISKRNSRTLSNKPFLIWLLTTPSHLKYVATLPCN